MSLSLAKFLKYTDLLNLPDTDELGNIRAQVGLRYDTLEELEVVTDAIEGELAICSDVNAAITYKGAPPSLPHIIAFDYLHDATVELSGTVPSGTETALSMVGTAVGPTPGIVNIASDIIDLPVYTNLEISKALFDVTLDGVPTDATFVNAALEIDNTYTGMTSFSGSHQTQGTAAYNASPNTNFQFHFDLSYYQLENLNLTGSNMGLRVAITHDGSTDWVLPSSNQCLFRTRLGWQAK